MSGRPAVRLGHHIEEVSVRKGETEAEILSVTNDGGFVRSLDVFDKQVFSRDTSNYKLVGFNELAYNPSRINVGSVAKCDLPRGGAVSPMYVVVRCRPSLLPQYLLYVLKSRSVRQLIAQRSVGGVRVMLRFRDLEEVEVPLPPVSEQARIVRLLDGAAGLSRLRAEADLYTSRLAPAYFRECFVRSARDWPVVMLDTECDRITVGYVGPMAAEYLPSGVPFLRSQNVKRGRIDLSGVLYISEQFHAMLSSSALRPGDVVSVRSGKPGATAVVPDTLPRANCADLIVMTPGDNVCPEFIAELLNQRLGDQESLQHAVGAAQKHFNIGEARRVEFRRPPKVLQQRFSTRVVEIQDLRAAQAASFAYLEELRESLVYSVIMGGL